MSHPELDTRETPLTHGPTSNPSPLSDEGTRGIPVETFIMRYNVTHPSVQELLYEIPSMCFFLGEVTDEPQTRDARPDGQERDVYFLIDGSGMFALEKIDDMTRWRGINNHIAGTTRRVQTLSEILANLTDAQIRRFGELGFDSESFRNLNPDRLTETFGTTHDGKRQADEYTWHNLRDRVHPSADSGYNSLELLKRWAAPQAFLEPLRAENHEYLISQIEHFGLLPNAMDNIWTYPDWTFGQQPMTLQERFEQQRAAKRNPPEWLNLFEKAGQSFEQATMEIVSPDIFEVLNTTGPYEWETKMRIVYCAPSGVSPELVFPAYFKQFPDQVPQPIFVSHT